MAYFMNLDMIMSDDSDAKALIENAGLSKIKENKKRKIQKSKRHLACYIIRN